jgi:hypothetical protein
MAKVCLLRRPSSGPASASGLTELAAPFVGQLHGALRAVFLGVLGRRKRNQILESVISPIPVYVVDMPSFRDRPVGFFPHQPMFEHVSILRRLRVGWGKYVHVSICHSSRSLRAWTRWGHKGVVAMDVAQRETLVSLARMVGHHRDRRLASASTEAQSMPRVVVRRLGALLRGPRVTNVFGSPLVVWQESARPAFRPNGVHQFATAAFTRSHPNHSTNMEVSAP